MLAGVAGGAATLSGCSWLDRTPPDAPTRTHPDVPALRTALEATQALQDAATATVAAHGGTRATVDGVLARGRTRLATLEAALADAPPTTGATATGTPTTGTPPTSPAPTVPGSPKAALAALRALATRGQQTCTSGASGATDAGVARLLAALTAGFAQEAVVLARAEAAA